MRKGCKYGILFSVFPARAGVILLPIPAESAILSIPRASGGDPQLAALWDQMYKYSPRERG